MNTYKVLLATISLALTSNLLAGDDLPKPATAGSEVYLFDLTFKNSSYQIANGHNISKNAGYDNQPYFTNDNTSILFASNRDGKQTDIYSYSLINKATTQLTFTPHNEFSPKTVANSSDISFVTEGENPYQSVWRLAPESGSGTWMLNTKEPVGYYSANTTTGDVLFWSRYGYSVQYINTKRDEVRFVSGNAIASSPQKIPNSQKFSFVHRQTNGEAWIKAFEPSDFSITPIAPIYGSNYDYTWAPNGSILRVENNQLFAWSVKGESNQWHIQQDLSSMFNGQVSRLAISPNGKKIALVENN